MLILIKTSTERNLEEARTRQAERNTTRATVCKELFDKCKCASTNCRNQRNYCYIPPGEARHIPVDADDIAEWAQYVVKDGDINEIELWRRKQSMPAYLFDRINEKALRKTQRQTAKPFQRLNSEPMPSGPVIHNHYTMFQPLDTSQKQQTDVGGSQSTLFSPYIGGVQSHGFRSSPAASESDDDHEMYAYMDYLIAKNPTKAKKLADIKERFRNEDMTLKKIHGIKVDGLRKEFDVSMGIAMDIVQGIKPYQRSRGLASQNMF